MAKKSYTHIKQKDFDFIKLLLNNNTKKSDIAKVTGRSPQTILYIEESKDLESYKENMRVLGVKYKKSSTSLSLPIKPEASKKNEDSEIVEALNRINATLGELAEAWKAKPKGFFR